MRDTNNAEEMEDCSSAFADVTVVTLYDFNAATKRGKLKQGGVGGEGRGRGFILSILNPF